MARARRQRPTSSLLEYGLIGDCHTGGLISRHGSLDWLCWPRLDSPSLFAAILDEQKGGHFSIRPIDAYQSTQTYESDTNILVTTFTTQEGEGRLIDFMPVEEIDRDDYNFQEVHRVLQVTKGRLRGDIEFKPRFNYARDKTTLSAERHGVAAKGGSLRCILSSQVPLSIESDGAFAAWDLEAGHSLRFVLRAGTSYVRPTYLYQTDEKLETTREYWARWIKRCSYAGPYAPHVRRSALALKLLTYSPTGALAAAATTSLPETPGGVRNWDYRFSWIRDSAFALEALHGVGYTDLARRYLRWLRRLLRGLTDDVKALRVCYGLEGESELPEETLGHLRGYLDSRPVRIGNAAALQSQHDIFGALANALYEAYQRPEGFPDEAWRTLRALADHVIHVWREPDHGIWEIRGEKRRYTHAALMSWVVLDRAIRVAHERGHPESAHAWSRERKAIRAAILAKAWNEKRRSFVMTLEGDDALDAALLAMPLVDFLPGNDPRIRSTIEAIEAELGEGPFVHRYHFDDGLPGTEGAFLILSFWMVRALVRAGRRDEAARRYEALLNLAGPLGLFSEQIDPKTRIALGNFPQAFTHLAVINAALDLQGVRTAPEAAATTLVPKR